MIVFGSGSTRLSQEQLPHYTCPSCQTTGATYLYIYAKYAHIYWIPAFSLGRKGYTKCNLCHAGQDSFSKDTALRYEWARVKASNLIPIWHFSMAGLILIISILFSLDLLSNKSDQPILLSSPQIGDVYYYQQENGLYSSMKIHELANDTLYIRYNEFETPNKSQLAYLNVDSKYANYPVGLSRSAISNLVEAGIIYEVKR